MSDELIVDPAAVATFAKQLADHVAALQKVQYGLATTSSDADALFGDFEGATEINARSSQLVGEMSQRLAAVSTSLANLQHAAEAASASYHAADHLSQTDIASINASLDLVEKTTAAAPGGQL